MVNGLAGGKKNQTKTNLEPSTPNGPLTASHCGQLLKCTILPLALKELTISLEGLANTYCPSDGKCGFIIR